MSKDYLKRNAGDYPVYSSQTANNGVLGKINTYDQDGTFITWTTDGANAGSVFYRDNEKFSITSACGLISNDSPERLDFKFLYYFLSLTAKKYVRRSAAIPALSHKAMSTVRVPLPPLSVQQEIAGILDKYTRLGMVGGAEGLLQVELRARQRQYEYYLNSLFPSCNNKRGNKL